MSAQRPGIGLGQADVAESPLEQTHSASPSDSALTLADARIGSWLGTRSFVVYANGRYDYLTQQPGAQSASSSSHSLYPPPAAEFMFGGGASRGEIGEGGFIKEVGIADDRSWNLDTGAYLGGALSMYFGGWGAEGRDFIGKRDTEESDASRVKKLWTGILGVSADGQPWVGRLSTKISGRPAPRAKKSVSKDKPASRLAPPGEWISAGYSGEGMVHAYLSGKALAHMVFGKEDTGLPDAFLVTDARWKKAKLEDLVQTFIVE